MKESSVLDLRSLCGLLNMTDIGHFDLKHDKMFGELVEFVDSKLPLGFIT